MFWFIVNVGNAPYNVPGLTRTLVSLVLKFEVVNGVTVLQASLLSVHFNMTLYLRHTGIRMGRLIS